MTWRDLCADQHPHTCRDCARTQYGSGLPTCRFDGHDILDIDEPCVVDRYTAGVDHTLTAGVDHTLAAALDRD